MPPEARSLEGERYRSALEMIAEWQSIVDRDGDGRADRGSGPYSPSTSSESGAAAADDHGDDVYYYYSYSGILGVVRVGMCGRGGGFVCTVRLGNGLGRGC